MKKISSVLSIGVLAIFYFTVSVFAQEPPLIVDPDRFPGVSFEVEKRRLTEAAKLWKLDIRKNIYLIVYSKISGKTSDATKRLRRSKDYLRRIHKIPSKKIIPIYGGTLPELEMVIIVTQDKKENDNKIPKD
jgi:hypothetical protein